LLFVTYLQLFLFVLEVTQGSITYSKSHIKQSRIKSDNFS